MISLEKFQEESVKYKKKINEEVSGSIPERQFKEIHEREYEGFPRNLKKASGDNSFLQESVKKFGRISRKFVI